MDMSASYGQFCPVAMASEIICTRWTPLILRELMAGSRRFNDLRRGLPRISPTLLSKRLRELTEAGIIEIQARTSDHGGEYRLTAAGTDLREIIMALGTWGQRWVDPEISLQNLDPTLLMWDMRRNLNTTPLPPQRCTIRLRFPEVTPTRRTYWLVVDGPDVDLCYADPGFDVDVYVESSLHCMTAIWMGATTVSKEVNQGRLEIDGDKGLVDSMESWLGLSPFARATSASHAPARTEVRAV